MTVEKSKAEKGLLHILFGVGIGGILAFMLAPKTRRHSRGSAADAAPNSPAKAEESTDELSEKSRIFFQDTKIKADEFYESAKQKIDSAAASIIEKSGEIKNAAENKGGQIVAGAANNKNKSALPVRVKR